MFLTRWKSASEQGPETQDFNYGLLKSAKTGIRLAQILPGTGNKGIAINLIDSFVSGTNQIEYDALSYTWGDLARTKNVTCNGKRLAVTHTLFEALHRFRKADNPVTLWIDQICICVGITVRHGITFKLTESDAFSKSVSRSEINRWR